MIKIKKIICIFLISLFAYTEANAAIEDALYATVGNKAITRSDIVNEIKIFLILNNQSFSQDKKKRLEKLAIGSIVKRNVKQIEIDKYDNIGFNQEDLEAELIRYASNIDMDLITFESVFKTNGIDFSIVKDQLKTELLWNSLIFQLYKDRLSINQEELEEQLKLAMLDKEINEYLMSEIIIKAVPKDKVKSTVEEIKNKIKAEGFENVAMNLSIAETALSGGNLGWISENIIAEQFRSKITNTSIGDISEPILLPEGILFFKVKDKRKTQKFLDLEDAKQQLVEAEKTKMLNMYSLTHYDNLRRTISINYFQ